MTTPDDSPKSSLAEPLRYLAGGFEFAVLCLAGALAGRWLDRWLDTEPWFTAVLLITSFATATWLLLRGLTKAGRDSGSSDGTSSQ